MAHPSLRLLGVPDSGSFFCLAFRTNVDDKLTEPIPLGGGIVVFFRPPFDIVRSWGNALGRIRSSEFGESNCLVFCFSHEHDARRRQRRVARSIYYGLLMFGAGHASRGMALSGTVYEGQMHANTVEDFERYSPPLRSASNRLTEALLLQAFAIGKGLINIYQNDDGPEYRRLRKGVNKFLDGAGESQWADQRLHCFVRSLEAVVRPAIGHTKRQFVHRCQFFAKRSPESQQILSEIYDIRSAAEHLNPPCDTLPDYSEVERTTIVSLRALQVEILAAHVYGRILTDPGLVKEFVSDTTTTSLWTKEDHEHMRLWGPPIDLVSAAKSQFPG